MVHFSTSGSPASGLVLDNISTGETVYQRCILLIGKCASVSDEDFIDISSSDSRATNAFPTQNWPVSGGRFKALAILSPGSNSITLKHWHNGQVNQSTNLTLNYTPLLQTPPLHLAIMIAKDSPLLIDCPPHKRGGISSAHSDLDAAIKKFRMTAYMWQALTAQDMYAKGLGRRSFRLEEEWTAETLSREFIQASNEGSAAHMRSTAKIHLIRSEKTVAQIRDVQLSQQSENVGRKNDLFDYFNHALKAYEGPFAASAHPVVAGLILDSAFSIEQNLILGHAALACSNPNGISLGMFGSHLTYSWPRFLEEVPASLLDTAAPGDMVGNDNGECGTIWEACSIGQGAFLHEVGHAFGAPHTTGIMARGYSEHWPKNFLSRTAYCDQKKRRGEVVIDGETKNEARWDIRDALSFRLLPHFKLPIDPFLSKEAIKSEPSVQVVSEDDKHEFLRLIITSPVQIARVTFDGVEEPVPTILCPLFELQFTLHELEARFDRTESLKLEILSMNGKSKVVGNLWNLFTNTSFIRVPGSPAVLQKKSVISNSLEGADSDSGKYWKWAVLLTEKGENGKSTPATRIDSRVGCILDGAVVYFKDGHKTHCGPRWSIYGDDHDFGGHASEDIAIPEGVEVIKVEVGHDGNELNGLRFHLSNGNAGGYLYEDSTSQTLEPSNNEKIIGFYGRSDWGSCFDGIQEFGIITAPKDMELPISIYDLPELQNTDGGNGPRPNGNDSGDENDSEKESNKAD